jgi:hypothetical protein
MKDGGQDNKRPAGQAARDKRQDRLKLALRENLKRRKSQARERADFTPASLASGDVAREGGGEDGPGK